jgi:hypothetical protein
MDFLTGLPYWGIAVVVIVNALVVIRMDIRIDDDEDSPDS